MVESLGSGWNRDTAIGVIGAVILIAAMAGVFLYERGQFHEYDISWQATEIGSSDESGTLDQGQSDAYTFTVPAEAQGVAQVRVILEWTDDVGEPDTFELAAAGPDGQTAEPVTGASGTLELTIDVADEPAMSTAVGRSQEDAQEQAQASLTSDAGQGDWSVTVTLQSAPGQALAAGQESQGDGSNGYTVTFAYDAWEPVIEGETS